MATFKKKLASQQVPAQANVGNWQAQQAAAVVPGGVQVGGAAPAGYPAAAAPVTTAPVAQAPPTVTQV